MLRRFPLVPQESVLDRHHIANSVADTGVRATIKADGAELCSLRSSEGEELLWQAGPAWPRHAPVLFPVVGRLKDDRLRLGGESFPLTQHGFARDRRFRWIETGPTHCRLRLEDSPETRAQYPFAFRFDVLYAITGDRLDITYVIANPGPGTLPASAGAHPAFRWPLREGIAKEAHFLSFGETESEPIRRLGPDGLLSAALFPSPVQGKVLPLDEELFRISALIFEHPASRSVRYSAPGAPTIEVSWEGFRQLGVWMKRGADFLCIEPWHGLTSAGDFDGDFPEKPGLLLIPPAEERHLTHSIRVIP